MTNNTEQQAVPVAQEAAIVAVTQADRDAVRAFHRKMLDRLMSDVKSQRPKLGDDEGDAGTLVQAFARHRLSLPCKSGEGAGQRSLCVAMREINEMAVGVGDIFPNDATAIVAIGQTASAALDVFDAQIVGDAKAYVEAMAIVAADPVAALAALRTDATQTREAELVAAAQAVVDDYPVAAGKYPSLEGADNKPGYGSIRRLSAALNARGGA